MVKNDDDTSTCDTFTEHASKNRDNNLLENINKMTHMIQDHIRSSSKNDNITKIYDNTTDEKINGYSLEVSQVATLSHNQK